jgi:uncharacterized protein (DUF4415 family)
MIKRNVGRPPIDNPMTTVTIRLPVDVLERYREYANYTVIMREALIKYVDKIK